MLSYCEILYFCCQYFGSFEDKVILAAIKFSSFKGEVILGDDLNFTIASQTTKFTKINSEIAKNKGLHSI